MKFFQNIEKNIPKNKNFEEIQFINYKINDELLNGILESRYYVVYIYLQMFNDEKN